MNEVWVVTYCDVGAEPVITVFNNAPAAQKCFDAFIDEHIHVFIDRIPVYSKFIVKGEV